MLNGIYNSDMAKISDNRRAQKPQFQSQKKEPVLPRNDGPVTEDRISLGLNSSVMETYGVTNNNAQGDSGFLSLREMLSGILEEQGIMTRIDSRNNSVDFKDISPEKAKELISDEGYLGIEQTSDRIVQFAISISGNDPDRLEEIKASIDKGFHLASKALGGTLPDISMKTYDAVMEKLNAWVEDSEKSASLTDNHQESADAEQ